LATVADNIIRQQVLHIVFNAPKRTAKQPLSLAIVESNPHRCQQWQSQWTGAT
jgi:hypothetical protein